MPCPPWLSPQRRRPILRARPFGRRRPSRAAKLHRRGRRRQAHRLSLKQSARLMRRCSLAGSIPAPAAAALSAGEAPVATAAGVVAGATRGRGTGLVSTGAAASPFTDAASAGAVASVAVASDAASPFASSPGVPFGFSATPFVALAGSSVTTPGTLGATAGAAASATAPALPSRTSGVDGSLAAGVGFSASSATGAGAFGCSGRTGEGPASVPSSSAPKPSAARSGLSSGGRGDAPRARGDAATSGFDTTLDTDISPRKTDWSVVWSASAAPSRRLRKSLELWLFVSMGRGVLLGSRCLRPARTAHLPHAPPLRLRGAPYTYDAVQRDRRTCFRTCRNGQEFGSRPHAE